MPRVALWWFDGGAWLALEGGATTVRGRGESGSGMARQRVVDGSKAGRNWFGTGSDMIRTWLAR